MADPLVATHKAIYEALEAALSIPVYDFVPQDATYPYVEIEKNMTIRRDSLVAQKDGVYTYLTVWSDYKGQKEVLEHMETIYAALHRAKLSLDAGVMVRCLVQDRDTNRDMDETTFTGSVKLFTLVEH